MLSQNVNVPLGAAPWTIDGRCTARGGAFTRGQVGALDLGNTDGDVTNNKVGDPASGWSNVITPGPTDVQAGFIVVALEDVADNQKAQFRMEGEVYAYVLKSSGNIAKGDPLYAANGVRGYLIADPNAGDRMVATAIDGATAPTVATLSKVHLKGSTGKGTFVS